MAHDGGARAAILDAALHEIADRELDELLKCLTPGGLAHGQEFSPSTVRYHFGREPARFDREALAVALVDELGDRLRAQAHVAAAGYRQAIDRVRDGVGIAAVEEALSQDLNPFVPGASEAQDTASDRLYLLAVAMCDSSPALTGRLRAMREDILTTYDAVYEHVLRATRRRMMPGTAVRELTLAVNAFLEGLMVLGRQHAVMEVASIARGVLLLIWAYTEDEDAPNGDVAAAFLASVR